jgi:hypothetical protein
MSGRTRPGRGGFSRRGVGRNGVSMSQRHDIDETTTPASLDALAAALSVRWPDWYVPFVLELADAPHEPQDFWLPGGFIFASPRRAYEETMSFRRSELFFTGAPSSHLAGPAYPARPLPDRYVVVGRTGDGPVIVDTASEAASLLSLSNEGYWCDPLIDFEALGRTPVDLAREIAVGPSTKEKQ